MNTKNKESFASKIAKLAPFTFFVALDFLALNALFESGSLLEASGYFVCTIVTSTLMFMSVPDYPLNDKELEAFIEAPLKTKDGKSVRLDREDASVFVQSK